MKDFVACIKAVFILCLLLPSCHPTQLSTVPRVEQEGNVVVQLDWSVDAFIQEHYDSLMHDIKMKQAPSLLTNPCFDYDNKYVVSPHHIMSLRYEVIKKIKRKRVLNFLIQKAGMLAKDTCTNLVEPIYGNGEGGTLPHQGKSTYQLLLNKKKRKF